MSQPSFLPQTAINSTQILPQLKSGQLLMLDPLRRSGLIVCKSHYAELAGPGAAVGGFFDLNCARTILLGDVVLVRPESYEARQDAYTIRQQWISLTQQATSPSVPLRRGEEILSLLELHFGAGTVSQLADETVALLAGVLPHTIQMARQSLSFQQTAILRSAESIQS